MHFAASKRRTWRFPQIPVENLGVLTLLGWAGTLVLAFTTAFAVSFAVDISISVVNIISGAANWFLAIISGYAMFQYVPMFIANGRTRRDSMIFVPILALLSAFLMTVAYLLEYVVYGMAGWPRELGDNLLIGSHTDVAPIFMEHLLQFLVWITVGGFIGISIYRSEELGWLSILPGLALAALASAASHASFGTFDFLAGRLPDGAPSDWPLAILAGVVCASIAIWITWLVLRNMPLRNV